MTKILYFFPPARVSNEVDTFRALKSAEVITVGSIKTERPSDITLRSIGLPWLGSPKRWAGALAWYVGSKKRLNLEPDIIVSHEMGTATSIQANRVARMLGVPHVIVVAQILPDYPLYRLPPWKFWMRRIASKADAFFCLNEASAENARHFGAPAKRVHVVTPGVDTSLFFPLPMRESRPIVSFIGELRPDKGILDAIAAAEIAADSLGPEFQLVVAGAGPLLDEVRNMALSRPWLNVLGFKERKTIPEVLRSSRAMMIAPWSRPFSAEQFGFALVEAMACGLPIVTTNCGAIPSVVPEGNWVVDEHDIEALANGLIESLKDDADAVGKNNRTYVVEHYELQKQSDRLSETITRVLQNSIDN